MRSSQRFFLFHNNSGNFSEIGDGTVCGRVEGELLYPEDALISRRHCRFVISGSEVYIEDFGSKNSTRVNGVPLAPGRRRRLRLHDVIELGAQRLILTNREGYAPQNTQDAAETPRLGLEKTDGSITVVTGPFHLVEGKRNSTLVHLDRPTYQKLKVRRRLRQTVDPLRKPGAWRLLSLVFLAALLVAAALIGSRSL